MELFDKYIDPNTPINLKDEIGLQIKNDPLLQKEFDEYEKLTHQIQELEEDNLADWLFQELQESKKNATTTKRLNFRLIRTIPAIAAGVMFLLMSYNSIYFDDKINSRFHPSLYKDVLRSGDILKTTPFEKGKDFMNKGEFRAAKKEFEKIEIEGEKYDLYIISQYYIAFCHLELKDRESAKIVLEELLKDERSHWLKEKKIKGLLKALNRPKFFYF